MSSRSYQRELNEAAEQLGYVVHEARAGCNHIRITHPKVKSPIFASSTPSDCRAIKNTIAKMKRYLRETENA